MAPAGPSTGTGAKAGELASIQFLRFLASTLVVLFHSEVQLYRLSGGARENHVPFASFGTDLFFVISGFIMVYITYNKRTGFSDFMRRRIVRIVPLYWLYMCALIALWVVWRKAFHSTALNPWHVMASFAFLPYAHPVLGVQQPLMPVGWTLNYYMSFYLLFAAVLCFRPAERVAAAGLVLCLLVAAQAIIDAPDGPLHFYGATVQLEFLYGMLVALLVLKVGKGTAWFCIAALAAFAAIFGDGLWLGVSEGADRALFWGLSAAFLLLGCVLIERRWGWPADALSQSLGNASYSIFLSNLFSLGACGLLLKYLHAYESLGPGLVQAVLVVCAVGAGYGAHLAIEKPLMKRLSRGAGMSMTRLTRGGAPSVPPVRAFAKQ